MCEKLPLRSFCCCFTCRKFAAGDPFFWPAEKTGRDDDAKDEHAQKSPFSPSTKQGLPPRSSSFGKTSPPTGRHQHSTAFSPADGNSGQPQAFRKAPVSTGKRPSDRLKELGECMASGHGCFSYLEQKFMLADYS